MRTLLLLAITCAAGCTQIADSDPIDESTAAAAATTVAPEQSWRSRWTTPHDGITISSAGMVSLVPDAGTAIKVFHLRVTVQSQESMTSVDASATSLKIPGWPTEHPLAVSSDVPTLPLAIVEAGRPDIFDLFFSLPKLAGPIVVFSWSLTTPNASRQVEALVKIDANAPIEKPQLGRRWWFAPTYSWSTFRHRDGVITPQPPNSARVPELVGVRDEADDTKECEQW